MYSHCELSLPSAGDQLSELDHFVDGGEFLKIAFCGHLWPYFREQFGKNGLFLELKSLKIDEPYKNTLSSNCIFSCSLVSLVPPNLDYFWRNVPQGTSQGNMSRKHLEKERE